MIKLMKGVAAAAVLSMAAAGTAHAGISTLFTPGGDAPGGSDTLLYDFDGTGNVGDFSGSGAGFVVQTGSNGSGAQNPFSLPGGNYLSVLGGGSASLTFDNAMKSISFNWGSVDTYNTLTIHWSGGNEVVIGNPGGGNQQNAASNGLFQAWTTGSDYITGLTFASTGNSFEVDDISGTSAVPEPATWAMMITGFGLAGAAIRRRRTSFAAA